MILKSLCLVLEVSTASTFTYLTVLAAVSIF